MTGRFGVHRLLFEFLAVALGRRPLTFSPQRPTRGRWHEEGPIRCRMAWVQAPEIRRYLCPKSPSTQSTQIAGFKVRKPIQSMDFGDLKPNYLGARTLWVCDLRNLWRPRGRAAMDSRATWAENFENILGSRSSQKVGSCEGIQSKLPYKGSIVNNKVSLFW